MRIMKTRHIVVVLAATLALACLVLGGREARAETAHDFTFRAIDGADLPLAQYRGQPVLVVNTASFCGYTPQYDGLQALYDAYRDQGLVVLGVPSNDFGNQEPGSAAEIKEFCEVNFAIDFPLTEKQTVRGPDAHPLYRWIGAELGRQGLPRWNFHKYLINGAGRIAGHWPSRVEPMSAEIRQAVEAMLPGG
ncbi:MAG: glutathione peroxidase [Rhizobiales bacterium NRL2]|jgi:glutathione peroxidase|nr:MAG: glutathione peroxidase [Rhizobiales bacterium NRL2]